MTLPTFGQLLAEYMSRSGISDSELARSIGVRRQTIFRWKEGLVERPRAREDVLQCAKKLRLSDEERDRLLLTAGFAPEQLGSGGLRTAPTTQTDRPSQSQPASQPPPNDVPAPMRAAAQELVDELGVPGGDEQPTPIQPLVTPLVEVTPAATPGSSPLTPLAKTAEATMMTPLADASTPALATAPEPALRTVPPQVNTFLHLLRSRQLRWWPVVAALLVVGVIGLVWARSAAFWPPTTPTPAPPATVILHPPPQTTPTSLPLAREGETLLLIAQFKGYTPNATYNVAGRISEELEQQLAAAGLISTTVRSWSEEIVTAVQARALLTATNATILIWGEYDSGRVRVNLDARESQASNHHDFNLTPNDELVTTINEIVPKGIRDTALLALGTLAHDQGKYPIAVGRRLSDLGNYQAATTVFQHALDLKPPDPATAALLNFYLGYLTAKHEQVSDYERAMAYYSQALDLNPALYTALYNRGTLAIKAAQKAPANETLIVEKLNAAIADLTSVIMTQPDYVDAYLNRGIAYYERDTADDLAAALADFDQVIAMKPDYARAYYSRGLAHIRNGQGEQWVADFEKVLTLQPDYTDAVSGLCWGYVLAQQAETAMGYCEQAVKYDQTGASRDSRAIAYAQLGRYPDAIADFRAYLDWLETHGSVFDYARYRGPFVAQWIIQLAAGQNPFDSTLLDKLRHRDHE